MPNEAREIRAILTINEDTINDAYLIVSDNALVSDPEWNKISYYSNLVQACENLGIVASQNNGSRIENLRSLVLAAEKNGYRIYQLTRL